MMRCGILNNFLKLSMKSHVTFMIDQIRNIRTHFTRTNYLPRQRQLYAKPSSNSPPRSLHRQSDKRHNTNSNDAKTTTDVFKVKKITCGSVRALSSADPLTMPSSCNIHLLHNCSGWSSVSVVTCSIASFTRALDGSTPRASMYTPSAPTLSDRATRALPSAHMTPTCVWLRKNSRYLRESHYAVHETFK